MFGISLACHIGTLKLTGNDSHALHTMAFAKHGIGGVSVMFQPWLFMVRRIGQE